MVYRRLELDEGRPIARQLREANRVLMEVIGSFKVPIVLYIVESISITIV